MKTKKFEEFINEENMISAIKTKIKNFDLKNRKEEIIGILKALVNMNDGVEMIDGGVKINRGDNIYYLYTNGKVVFPQGSEINIDENKAKELFYEFIKKK